MKKNNKQLYYIQLHIDFFNSQNIKIIEGLENGHLYVNIWLKLLLIAIQQKEPGILKYNENLSYSPKILSSIFNISSDHIEKALHIFQQLKMLETSEDGVLYIETIVSMVGKVGESTKRVQAFRQRQKFLKENPDIKNLSLEKKINENGVPKKTQNLNNRVSSFTENKKNGVSLNIEGLNKTSETHVNTNDFKSLQSNITKEFQKPLQNDILITKNLENRIQNLTNKTNNKTDLIEDLFCLFSDEIKSFLAQNGVNWKSVCTKLKQDQNYKHVKYIDDKMAMESLKRLGKKPKHFFTGIISNVYKEFENIKNTESLSKEDFDFINSKRVDWLIKEDITSKSNRNNIFNTDYLRAKALQKLEDWNFSLLQKFYHQSKKHTAEENYVSAWLEYERLVINCQEQEDFKKIEEKVGLLQAMTIWNNILEDKTTLEKVFKELKIQIIEKLDFSAMCLESPEETEKKEELINKISDYNEKYSLELENDFFQELTRKNLNEIKSILNKIGEVVLTNNLKPLKKAI